MANGKTRIMLEILTNNEKGGLSRPASISGERLSFNLFSFFYLYLYYIKTVGQIDPVESIQYGKAERSNTDYWLGESKHN